MVELRAKIKNAKHLFALDTAKLYKVNQAIYRLQGIQGTIASRKEAACIRNRNSTSSLAICNDYEMVLKQFKQDYKTPLQVFCVSAKAYFDFTRDDRNSLPSGFLNISDTGIPSLRRWLQESTLNIRNQAANSFLESILSLEASMKIWMHDKRIDHTISLDQKNFIEKAFDDSLGLLTKVGTNVFLSTKY